MVLQTLGKGRVEGGQGEHKACICKLFRRLGEVTPRCYRKHPANTVFPPCVVGQGVERPNLAVV